MTALYKSTQSKPANNIKAIQRPKDEDDNRKSCALGRRKVVVVRNVGRATSLSATVPCPLSLSIRRGSQPFRASVLFSLLHEWSAPPSHLNKINICRVGL